MSNYNERLDKILGSMQVEEYGTVSKADTKQALTSLIKELVEEAKPEFISPDQPLGLKYQGRNEAIRDFEQNILKALGEI